MVDHNYANFRREEILQNYEEFGADFTLFDCWINLRSKSQNHLDLMQPKIKDILGILKSDFFLDNLAISM